VALAAPRSGIVEMSAGKSLLLDDGPAEVI
jgi:hypothetical protein